MELIDRTTCVFLPKVLANHPSLGDCEEIPDQLALAREVEVS